MASEEEIIDVKMDIDVKDNLADPLEQPDVQAIYLPEQPTEEFDDNESGVAFVEKKEESDESLAVDQSEDEFDLDQPLDSTVEQRPTEESEAEKKVRLKKLDNEEKLIIANNILQACKNKTETETSYDETLNILQHYTKQIPEYLLNVIHNNQTEGRSLKHVLMDTAPIPSTLQYIQGDIRYIFVQFYVEKQEPPSKLEFLKMLRTKRDDSFYRNVTLRKLVNGNLVKYHHIPKLNRVLLTENPQFAYTRHLYLRQIINCRRTGKNVNYVSIIKMPIYEYMNETKSLYLTLAASSTAGLISKDVTYAGEDFSNEYIRSWLQHQLLPMFPADSVVVIRQHYNIECTPTHNSTKDEMCKFLEKLDIPFDTESHRADLYRLIKVYKKKYTSFCEDVLSNAGLQVLNCPIEYEDLDFFKDILAECKSGNVAKNMVTLMTKMSREEWVKIESRVIREEKQMMSDDNEMERVLSNIFEMVNNGDVKTEDFPDGCTGTKADNFNIHIGNIIVD